MVAKRPAKCGECGGTGEIVNDGPFSVCGDCSGTGFSVKDPAAVKLGRKGGKSRAKKMTAKQRSEAARKASLARWKKGESR